ncbi:NADH dehydrogenase 1 alpha subcomplex assembly factor 3 [Cyathus striatus]|nr:NADH dehydrogenase 1 alpha subcomplex assembly factor 3 [Cyathus striatus]
MALRLVSRSLPRSIVPATAHITHPVNILAKNPIYSHRLLTTTTPRRASTFTNVLASDIQPPVQVSSLSEDGIRLSDGLLIKGACIFLEGNVFLWDVPESGTSNAWKGWSEDRFNIFEVVVPKPEILLLGTGKTTSPPPPSLRAYLNKLGIQLDVMDTRNACSTYNLLAEEGRRVAAALLPYKPYKWEKASLPEGKAYSRNY